MNNNSTLKHRQMRNNRIIIHVQSIAILRQSILSPSFGQNKMKNSMFHSIIAETIC